MPSNSTTATTPVGDGGAAARRVLRETPPEQVPARMQTALVLAYSRAGDAVPMFEALARMADAGVPVSAGLEQSLAAGLSFSVANVDGAYYKLADLSRDLITPASINVVIRACGLVGDTQRAFATADEAVTEGFFASESYSAATLDALLSACAANGDAKQALEMAAQRGEPLPARAQGDVVLALARSGDVDRAVAMLTDAAADGRAPSTDVFRSLVNKLLRRGRRTEALGLMRTMRELGYPVASRLVRLAVGSVDLELPPLTPEQQDAVTSASPDDAGSLLWQAGASVPQSRGRGRR